MRPLTIPPLDLYARLGGPDAPIMIDVCRCDDFDAEPRLVPSARWRDHRRVDHWAHELPRGVAVVTICVRGKKVSQAAAAELRLRGIDAAALEGGNEAWQKAGLPTVAKRLGVGNREGRASRWVTRVGPKVDRMACAWLIQRFIDPAARFLFVEPREVLAAAAELDAIPYDAEGVEIGHRGERCSFDALLADFSIRDKALDHMAIIVRGADTGRPDLAPEAAGLLALASGISGLAGADDHVALERGFGLHDALHAWTRARLAAAGTSRQAGGETQA